MLESRVSWPIDPGIYYAVLIEMVLSKWVPRPLQLLRWEMTRDGKPNRSSIGQWRTCILSNQEAAGQAIRDKVQKVPITASVQEIYAAGMQVGSEDEELERALANSEINTEGNAPGQALAQSVVQDLPEPDWAAADRDFARQIAQEMRERNEEANEEEILRKLQEEFG